MQIELIREKKLLHQKKIIFNYVTKQLSCPLIIIKNINKISSRKAEIKYHVKVFLSEVIKWYFLHRNPLYNILIRKLPVDSSNCLFINVSCSKEIVGTERLKELDTLKMAFCSLIRRVKSLIKLLFFNNYKNIFVHFSEKTNLSLSLDIKTQFSAWKMLQTTTI